MKTQITVGLTIGILALGVAAARAEQGGSGHYASGTYLDFSGMPPSQPGLYLVNYFLDYDNGTFNVGKNLPLGGVFAANAVVNLQVNPAGALYAYPFSVHNVTFSSGAILPYMFVDVKAGATYTDPKGTTLIGRNVQQSTTGIGDMQIIPVAAAWTNGDFTVGGYFNIWAPTGDYDQGQLANTGLNYWTFEPMLAFSWISSKFGTEFSIFPAIDFNTENHVSDYQSGDIFHVDATLAQHLPLFGGIVGAGCSAFYLQQITGDSGSGARLGSFEAKSYGVGPTVSYVHKIGSATVILDGSWLPQTYADNTTKGNYYWAKLSLVF